jgi:hypothetical protein
MRTWSGRQPLRFFCFTLLARHFSGTPQIAKLPNHKANASAHQNHNLDNFQHQDGLTVDFFPLL